MLINKLPISSTLQEKKNLSFLLVTLFIFFISCTKENPEKEKQKEILLNISKNFILKNEPKRAIASLLELEKEDPANSEIKKLLGLAYYKSEALNLAEETFLKSYDLNPKDLEICLYLAQLYADIARWNEVISWANKALDNILFPNPHVAYNLIGWAYYNLSDHQNALKSLKQSITNDGNYVLAYNNIGKVYFDQKRYKKAGETFVKLITMCSAKDKCPNFYLSEFYYRLALCYKFTENREKALKYLKKALDIAPKSKYGLESQKLIKILGNEL